LRGDNARGGGTGASWHRRRDRERAGSRGGDAHPGGTTCPGPTVRGEGQTSAQSSWPVAGDRDAPVSGRGVASGRSDVSERRGRTNPSARPGRPSGHTHAIQQPHRGAASGGGGVAYRSGWPAGTVLDLDRGAIARGGGAGGGAAVERGQQVGEEMRVGEGWLIRVQPCAVRGGHRHVRAGQRRQMVMCPCRGGASCRGGAACRRGASRRGGAQRGRARRGEEATMAEEERRGGDLGKQLSDDLEGDRAYIEPPTFCYETYSEP
jgi:hypothetical protein